MDESRTVSLEELGVEEDPGTAWHPRKVTAFMDSGDLPDLTDEELEEHLNKSEQYPDSSKVLSAEDSEHSPEGEV